MEKGHKLNFRKEVVKALYQGIINKVEAKECLKRGFGKHEIPIFFDFSEEGEPLLRHYVLGLEKIGFIEPLIRVDDGLQE